MLTITVLPFLGPRLPHRFDGMSRDVDFIEKRDLFIAIRSIDMADIYSRSLDVPVGYLKGNRRRRLQSQNEMTRYSRAITRVAP